MNRSQTALSAAAMVCFTAIVVANVMAPVSPPVPLAAGATKLVRDNTRYQNVLEKCMIAQPGYIQSCRSAAEEASDTTMYWDGVQWSLPAVKPL